jgi:hypothetical protein
LFLARRGHRVTLLERDRQPPVDGPDEVFSVWSRPGVPQARQPHNFLGRSVRVRREEAPDLLETLIAHGALVIPMELGEGAGDAMLCARRPLYESAVRQAVEAECTIAVRVGEAVTDLVIRAAKSRSSPALSPMQARGSEPIWSSMRPAASHRCRGCSKLTAPGRP